MPLQILADSLKNTKRALWYITESEEELLTQGGVFLAANQELDGIQQPEKRREWLASRLLIAKATQMFQLPYQGISKDEFNKPSLIGITQELSLSHTRGMAAVAFSPEARIGIDAEFLSPRIARIAHKFLHEEELEQAAGNWEELLTYWCSKESLYKLYGKKGLIFKDQIRVERITGENSFRGTIYAPDEIIQVQLEKQTTKHHIIVAAIEQ